MSSLENEINQLDILKESINYVENHEVCKNCHRCFGYLKSATNSNIDLFCSIFGADAMFPVIPHGKCSEFKFSKERRIARPATENPNYTGKMVIPEKITPS